MDIWNIEMKKYIIIGGGIAAAALLIWGAFKITSYLERRSASQELINNMQTTEKNTEQQIKKLTTNQKTVIGANLWGKP